MFAQPGRARPERSKSKAIRLPEAEIDGYSLGSGVARAERHPATFHIPSFTYRPLPAERELAKAIG